MKYLLLSALIAPACLLHTVSLEQSVYQRVADSSVLVDLESSMGSGVVVYASDGYTVVLTCAHVVKNDAGLRVIAKRGGRSWSMPATVLRVDAERDLAALAISGDLGLPAIKVAEDDPEDFERLYSVASPANTIGTASPQLLASKVTPWPSAGQWQIVGFIYPGSSGGPVANSRGELVCLIKGVRLDPVRESMISQMGLCVPRATLAGFVEQVVPAS